MFISKISRAGIWMVKELSRGKSRAIATAAYTQKPRNYFSRTQAQTRVLKEPIFQIHRYFSSTSDKDPSDEETEQEQEQEISVTFVDKDGEETLIKVPVGMNLLEAAHENDIELEGACEGSLACSTCHVIVMDMEYYNKLEDPTDEENDMLDLAFGLTETSRLGCQVIARPELDGLRVALPAATRNFAVDGYVPKPH